MIAHDAHPALALADRWQRGFPLEPHPFAAVAEAEGATEAGVRAAFEGLLAGGVLSRIGAVVRPNTAGASTLAALSCPPGDLARIAAIVSGEPFVNHNYERLHPINLWFVVAAPDEAGLTQTLQRIEHATDCAVLDLRLERAYHIDLGFRMTTHAPKARAARSCNRAATAAERSLLASMENGLPLVPQPYAHLASELGWREDRVISALSAMSEDGIISRFGCVINHRRVGYSANVMAVWDVPAEWVDAAGHRLAEEPAVTLSYRRCRRHPGWQYNLFAMVHGRDEQEVRREVGRLTRAAGLEGCDHAVLFSRQCFTQRGARFSSVQGGRA